MKTRRGQTPRAGVFGRIAALALIGAIAASSAWAQQEPAGDAPAYADTYLGFTRVLANPEDVALAEKDVEEAVKRFTDRVAEFRREVSNVVETYREYQESQLDKQYDKLVSELEDKEYQLVLSAIAQIELFLSRYPNTPEYSPDAMFRLAELYYQKAKREFDLVQDEKLREYEKQLAMFDEGLIDKEPAPPHADFGKPISLYSHISRDFPDYRYIDAVYYLLAYCYQEESNFPGVREAFENLIASRPQSKYVPESYLRIGDAYFKEYDYPPALQSFMAAAQFKDSEYYDQILYKLASTYFITDRFQDAIDVFAALNDLSEQMYEKDGKHSNFREESVQYIAYCYAQGENYWAGAGVQNAVVYFDRIGDRKWEADVFRQLGDYYVQQAKWNEAAVSYRRVIDKDPWHPDNPELQDKIIRIYVFGMRDEERQHVERSRLAKDYGETSEWARRNAADPDALRRAEELVQGSLKHWAYFQHAQAQKYRQTGKTAEAAEFYRRAAEAYQAFLSQFPHDRDAYDLTFRLADAHFFSGDYLKAVDYYVAVRDSKVSDKYFQDSAYSVVLCYDNLIGKSGLALTISEEQAQAQQRERLKGQVEKKPIPELKQKYLDASVFYVANTTQPLDQDKIAWNSGEILFEHNYLDEAREKYMDLVNRFPKSEFAVKAARRIIDTYYVSEDWVKVTEWSEKLAALEIGSSEGRAEMRAKLKEIKGNAMAQYAQQLEQREEWDKAAAQYMKAVEQEPQSAQAPAMLYNAAVNYARAKRPAKAMELFQRMVDDYPKAEFAAESLYLVAENAYDSYNLDQASTAYARLYAEYPNIDPKRRCLAIYNHAQLKEFDHDYAAAARIYERYADACAAAEADAPTILLRAGELYEKLEDVANMNRVYTAFIDRFGRAADNQRWVVPAYVKIADAYQKRKNPREAVKYYNKAIDFFLSHPGIGADFVANQAAAQSRFTLNEAEFEQYRAQGISGASQNAMKASFEKKRTMMNDMVLLYEQVKQFKNPEYFLAASFRMAEAVELFADSLFDAPIPKEVRQGGEDFVLTYQQMLSDQARPFYDQAAAAYLQAFDGGKKAKLFSSPWMKKLLTSLNHPNIKAVLATPVTMRKPEKPRFRLEVVAPLPFDDGRAPLPPKAPSPAPATPPAAPPG
ncbi:MAG: hypothetical protein C4523_11370 [Myxococcales bacterium]|nr:MAG: hypothetical protein C4523_11370 [Myxococcales bacterium]